VYAAAEAGIMDVARIHPPQAIAAGRQALSAGHWEEARAAFTAALSREETAAALEGLSWATWWLNDVAETFHARERAYRLYRDHDDDRSAARMAVVLAADYFLRRGEHAVANGWFRRAHRLLDGLDAAPEHAMLGIWESYVAVIFRHDTATARALGSRACDVARALGVVDLEMLAQAGVGFATVCEGEVERGMHLLDEAATAAIAGEMTDPDAIVTTCCYLISACERVRDYDRAAQWCDRAIALATRFSHRFMFAYCRSHYAGVLLWRGAWAEAEAELLTATGELATIFPAMAAEGIARLAELRRRQGRLDEAHALLDQLDAHPLRTLGSRPALLGRAALALDQGDPTTAIELAERFLRGAPAADQVERVDGLDLLARGQAARGEHARAAQTARALAAATTSIASPPLQALAQSCAGVVASAAGDLDEARRRLEDAIDLFDRSTAPYDAARARLDLAQVLAALGRASTARREAEAASRTLDRLGARRERGRAAALVDQLIAEDAAHETDPASAAGVTPRERDVLRLVARGLSDKEIAVALTLSEHTVHRHVSNILKKLHVPSRAAAVAQAAQHDLL
jgi:ATP/maltotriose-dependent transcriptional regulator MalT